MTFTRTLPKNKSAIPTKWVFTVKKDKFNNINKFKTRLVDKGFRQKKGIDYNLTYSPTLNMNALKLIIAIAAKFNWVCKQLDNKVEYLNARLDKEIYVIIPQGDRYFERVYWRLYKALYGLKQSGHQRNRMILKFLIKNEYKQLKSEQCIFIKENKNKLTIIIGIYVDDMIITGIENETNKIIKRIKRNFKISNSGDLYYILGIEIESKNNIYYISQKNYINTILKYCKMF